MSLEQRGHSLIDVAQGFWRKATIMQEPTVRYSTRGIVQMNDLASRNIRLTHPASRPHAGNTNRWVDAPVRGRMKISKEMSITDLLATVFDEDDDYSWSQRSEARDAIVCKFNAVQQGVRPTLVLNGRNADTWVINPHDIHPPEISG